MAWSGGTAQWSHTNVWVAGAGLIATYSADPDPSQGVAALLDFQFGDWLGTRRVLTDYTGNIEETCDSLPYGHGETCAPTPTEHLFTGKERDAESGNDYFIARYYSSDAGRFLSPDWSAKAEPVPYAKLDNPQSLKLYSYVYNNPVTGLDLDGHQSPGLGNGWHTPTLQEYCVAAWSDGTYANCTAEWETFVQQPWTELQAEINQNTQKAQQHLGNAVRDLKAAVSETTAKVTVGLGVGAKTSVGPSKLRAEVAEKDNLTFSNGKIAISNTMEAGVSGGTSKQIGLGGSITKVVGSYDMSSGSFGGTESPETEWVVGGRNGGSSAEASGGSLSLGGEEGEGVLGGGSISISKAGVQDLKNAWNEITSIF